MKKASVLIRFLVASACSASSRKCGDGQAQFLRSTRKGGAMFVLSCPCGAGFLSSDAEDAPTATAWMLAT